MSAVVMILFSCAADHVVAEQLVWVLLLYNRPLSVCRLKPRPPFPLSSNGTFLFRVGGLDKDHGIEVIAVAVLHRAV